MNALRRVKNLNPLVLFTIGAVLYGLVRAYLAETVVLDDTEYWLAFEDNYQATGNIIKSLLAVLLNADLLADTGDFRTYGLSRFIHVSMMLLSGDNCKVYAFLIGFLHMMSGFLVYRIIDFIIKNKECAFFCTLFYLFSPFERVQSFHHFSYLMLPFYFLLGYIFWEVKRREQEKDTGNIKMVLLSMLWIALVVFTGEHTLPMLFLVLLIFAIHEMRMKNKKGMWRYAAFMLWEVILFIGWYLIYNKFINRAVTSRFSFGTITLKEGLMDYWSSTVKALKSFLFIPMEYGPTIRTSVSRSSFLSFSLPVAILTLAACACMWLGMYRRYKRGEKKSSVISKKAMVYLVLFALSSSAIYVALEIFTQSFSQPPRYFYLTLTLWLIVLSALVNMIFKEKARILLSILLFVCVGYQIVWCSCFLNAAKSADKEIIAFLDEAESRNIENLVVYNSGWDWKQALNGMNTYSGESAFDWAVTAYGWLEVNSHFKNVAFVESGGFEEADKDHIWFFDERTQSEVLIDKNNLCFMGVSNISKFSGWESDIRRGYYYDWASFSTSADCYGIKYYSAGIDACNNYGITQKDSLIYIDVGNETAGSKGAAADKPFVDAEGSEIGYGYVGEGLMLSIIPEEMYTAQGDVGNYFRTNRYSGTPMEYRFSNLPEEEKLAVVIDGYEWWQYAPQKRVYDIEIKTDGKNYWIRNVDSYLLGYVEGSVNHKSVYRLMINLPQTREVSVVFHNLEGYDVATCNGIGIVRR